VETREFYRGFCARIRFCYSTQIYTGEVDGMSQPLVFQASSYPEAQLSFKSAVDDYLEHGDKPFDLFIEEVMASTKEEELEPAMAPAAASSGSLAYDIFPKGRRFDGG